MVSHISDGLIAEYLKRSNQGRAWDVRERVKEIMVIIVPSVIPVHPIGRRVVRYSHVGKTGDARILRSHFNILVASIEAVAVNRQVRFAAVP